MMITRIGSPDGPKNIHKVAIVHDWLVGGGAELVVLELHRMFPDAPIYTSYCTKEWRNRLDNKVVTGWLQHWPFSRLRKFIPFLRIKWFESLDLGGYDLVISSSGNGEAKGVRAGSQFHEGQTHICYCHSPTHFYWRHYDQYRSQPGFGVFNPLARLALRILVGPLRKWDLKAAARPDYYLANSKHIQADIKKYYDRKATVIHPPVDIWRFAAPPASAAKKKVKPGNGKASKETKAHGLSTPTAEPARHGFLTVGRQQPYKRTELIIEACMRLKLPLTVIGSGPQHDSLRRMASTSRYITFLTGDAADDMAVTKAMRQAEAFIFAAHEDFGITPIEALAAGTPLIAYRAGGALDYVEPGINGTFFEEQTVQSLMECLSRFKPSDYPVEQVRQTARQFSNDNFSNRLRNFLQNPR